jgi:HK97 family phage portal protein
MSSTGWMSTLEMQKNHYGNAFSLITGSGSQTRLIPLDSSKVSIMYDDATWFSEKPRLWYRYSDARAQHVFMDEEILHLRTSTSLDGIAGLSVRDILAQNFASMHAAQDTQNSLFSSGLTAKMIVQYTSGLSDENVKEFMKILDDYAKGKKKTESTDLAIPIPIGTQIQPLNIKLTDAQFVELKKYSALEIAAAMGIKPNQINDYDKSSYASAEAQQLSFYVDTLLYIIKMYEDEFNYKLLSEKDRNAGYFFKFNFGVLLRADLATQTEALTKAIQNSLYTPNEAREFVDMPALPGGDNLLCNGTMLPVRMAGLQYGGKEGTEG